ncbi:MAG: hypothetical protein IGS39_15185 [Calothrix sp. C42_A2020_038]|nr:hypothetical protein [Calothrix sp. C42_A2020_038]
MMILDGQGCSELYRKNQCIIRHARLHPDITKVFLSSNSKEFGQREVARLLQNTGIRYFSKTTNFLGWLQAQNL